MCGFLITSAPIDPTEIRHTNLRGPDAGRYATKFGLSIAHWLLAIRGHVEQPVDMKVGGVLCWNGEIYNTPALMESDTEWLAKGRINLKEIEGEYAICTVNGDTLELITDPFATKPAYWVADGVRFGVGSCPGDLRRALRDSNGMPYTGEVHHAKPNSVYAFRHLESKLIDRFELHTWDFEPSEDSFDNWSKRFTEVIDYRTNTDHKIMMPLSSGYDSGTVMAEILHLERENVEVFCFRGQEDQDILNERIQMCRDRGYTVHILDEEFEQHFDEIYDEMREKIEPLNEHGDGACIFQLKGCTPMCYAIRKATQLGCKIFLSGQGADEVHSDYSTRPASSSTGGNFTNVRKPWPNLFGLRQRHYLQVTERMTGAWGMEGRYPFIDRQLVQEFLWLNDELKNKEYKQCLAHQLRLRGMPFKQGVKSPWSGMQNANKFKKMHASAMKRHGVAAL